MLRYTNVILSDAPTEWAAGSELLYQCHLTQWVRKVYPSEKALLWLGFSGISSCENRQAHLQTKTRRWEGIRFWERHELYVDKIVHLQFYSSLNWLVNFNIIVCKHPTRLRYTCTPVPAELLQSVNNHAWLTNDSIYILYTELCHSYIFVSVNFCVVYVDKSLKPFRDNATVSNLYCSSMISTSYS